jgi:hypothetical protein
VFFLREQRIRYRAPPTRIHDGEKHMQPRSSLPTLFLLTVLLFTLVTGAVAQSPNTEPPLPNTGTNDHDINRTELYNFDRYLDDHPGVSRELKNNPNLINDPNWLAQHPSTQQFLQNHPGVKEEIRENPTQFMNRENRFERNGGDVSRAEAAKADDFLDDHQQVARQLRQNPKLIDDPQYLAVHPGLKNFLASHPEVKEDWKQHPNAFMKRQRQYEHHEGKKP